MRSHQVFRAIEKYFYANFQVKWPIGQGGVVF